MNMGQIFAAYLLSGLALASAAYAQQEAVSDSLKKSQTSTSQNAYTYAFTGDIMFGRYYGKTLKRHDTKANGELQTPYPLEPVRNLLEGPDYTVANLENPLLTRVPKDLLRAAPRFTTRLAGAPADAARLKSFGVDFVSLANNHINDAHRDGLKETIEHVEAAKLQHAGAKLDGDPYAPVRAESAPVETYIFSGTTFVNRIKVPIKFRVAVSPTWSLVNAFLPKIRALRKDRPNALIIFTIHWGPENKLKLMNHQQANARRLIDAGVDVVVGHHPHVLHPVEVYRGGVIFYSLGNFFFDQKHTLQRHGMLAHVTWTNTGPNKRPALSAVELHGIIRPYDLGPIQRADQQNRSQILGRIKGMSAKGHRTRFRWAGTAGILKWQSTIPRQ